MKTQEKNQLMTMTILGNLRARQQVANSCKQENLSLLLPNKDTV